MNEAIIWGLSVLSLSILTYLSLPGDGYAASSKLGVEIIVCLVKVHAFNRGELLNVQDIFTVHCPGLKWERESKRERTKDGEMLYKVRDIVW